MDPHLGPKSTQISIFFWNKDLASLSLSLSHADVAVPWRWLVCTTFSFLSPLITRQKCPVTTITLWNRSPYPRSGFYCLIVTEKKALTTKRYLVYVLFIPLPPSLPAAGHKRTFMKHEPAAFTPFFALIPGPPAGGRRRR